MLLLIKDLFAGANRQMSLHIS